MYAYTESYPQGPVGELKVLVRRAEQAEQVFGDVFQKLRGFKKENVRHVDVRFSRLEHEQYVVVVEVHCEWNGGEWKFVVGGAIPFRLDTSLEAPCLSGKDVMANLETFLRKTRWGKFRQWLKDVK